MGSSVRPEPTDERKIPPADLWDKKIAEGMSPDSATAYVSRIHGAPPAAAAPSRRPLIQNTQASTVRPDATASDRRVPADFYRDDLAGGLRTIEQGATLGFGDELNAGIRALMPGQHLADALADERSSVAGFRDRHPVGAIGAEVLGGMGGGKVLGLAGRAAGLPGMAPATTGVGRALRSTAAGATVGGVAAAGSAEGDISDRIRAMPRGMAFGAAAAATMNAAGAAVKTGGKALANRASQPTMVGKALRSAGIPTATDLAKGDLIRQLQRSGMSIDEAERAAATATPETMLMDVAGENSPVLRRTRGVRAIPSKGSQQIEQAITERVSNQPGRVQALVSRGLNGGQPRENAVEAAQKLITARRTSAQPLYEAAYKAAPIDDPDVIAAMKIPAFQEAHEIGRRIAKLEGVDLPPLTKEMVKVDGKSLSEQIPQSVQAIDYMKRGLDDLIEGKMRSGTMARTEARLLRQKLNGVLEKVDAAVPEYAKARAQFSGDSKLMEAHDAGREFLRTDRDELAAQWPDMSEGERELYRRGAMSELSTQLSKVADGRDVTRIFQNPLMREKLMLILPDQATANTFAKQLAEETQLHRNATFVRGGSQTADKMAETSDGLQDLAETSIHAFQGRPTAAAGSLFRRFANAETRGLTEAQADAVAPMLTARGAELAKVLGELRQYGTKATGRQALRSAGVRATSQAAGGAAGRSKP